jgi:hypothetical protein
MRKSVLLALSLVLVFCFLVQAKSRQTITVFNAGNLAGTELKPGEYAVDVADGQVIFFKGKKEVARAAVRTEQADKKFETSAIIYEGGKITEIHLAGSNQRLVVSGGGTGGSQ